MLDLLKKKYGKIHFVGIGGIGMSGIAEYLLRKGFTVKGSDLNKSEITDKLESLGAVIYEGHREENITDCDLVVYSSAVSEDNPEMVKANSLGIKSVKRSEILGELTRFGFTLGVAGTHGKTTVTAMLGIMLKAAGLEPTVFVGGVVKEFDNRNVRIGEDKYFVVEADEYDRTFLKLHPSAVIINNIEAEHLDIYKDYEDVRNTFIQFANRVPFYGFAIINADNEGSGSVKDKLNSSVVTYGITNDADVKAFNVRVEKNKTLYDVNYKGTILTGMEIGVVGDHNVTNSLAALTAALELDMSFEKLKTALLNFKGADRRFSLLYDGKITVIDDYAHHPTEVEASLKAAKNMNGRVVAVFQPHLFTRTRDFYKEFAEAFSQYADLLICLDVYPAREEPIEGISGRMIVDEVDDEKIKNKYFAEDKEMLFDIIEKEIANGDVILFMGAGSITHYAHELAEKLNNGESL